MSSADLVPLVDGWCLWRDVVLRGAGFAADGVLALAAPAAAAAADRWSAAEAAEAPALAAALDELSRAREAQPPAQRKAHNKAIRQLQNRAPDPFETTAAARAAIARVGEARAAAAAARATYAAALAQAERDATDVLCDLVADPRFREAVTWQNRAAIRTALDPLVRHRDDPSNGAARQRTRLVANYLQRYCVKNDTIGFFGPVCWAHLGATTEIRPGRALVSARAVVLEYWAIAAVGVGLVAAEPRLRAGLAPRRMPTVRIADTTMVHPVERESQLPLPYARLLAACDGARTAAEIAAALCADPALELAGVDEVYEMLDELVDHKVAIWRLELPLVGDPMMRLREALDRTEPAPRAAAFAILDSLEARRAAVAAAHDDPGALDHALSELESEFARIAGVAPNQHAGETYAARTIVYEDTLRDLDARIGAELLVGVGDALGLVLASARWYTHEIARAYRGALDAEFDALVAAGHGPAVDYIRFWSEAQRHFTGDPRDASPMVRAALDALQARWRARLEELAGGELGARARVQLASSDLRAWVATELAAPGPGFPSARYQCPDLMVATRDLTDSAPLVVLGEVHVSGNTLVQPLFVRFHPDVAVLHRATTRDLGEPRVAPAGFAERHHRAIEISDHPAGLDLEVGPTRSWRPRQRVLAIADLVVERAPPEAGGGLVVRTRDGEHRFDIIAFLDNLFIREVGAHFHPIPPMPHVPRVTIDRLVISRERWTVAAADLAFARADDVAQRFAGARAWVAARGLPRFAFYKVPEETKPCYVDFASPTYVESFCAIARKATTVHLSEMLPAVDEAWLTDADGRRYTSELRLAAVDPVPFRAPGPA